MIFEKVSVPKDSSVKQGMQIEKKKPSKPEEEAQLSGAYIRSLVKHLTPSKIKKGSMNPEDPEFRASLSESPQTQKPQHKKQVRRRLHTSRPYQERLLNMAEARKEIVTALKYHRAAMKEANEKQPNSQSVQERKIGAQITPNFSNYPDSYSCPAFSQPPPPNFSWPVSSIPPSMAEDLNFVLPNQPLGLNLNFQDFNNRYCNSNNFSVYSPSSPSPSSSSSPPIQEVHSVEISQAFGVPAVSDLYNKEMAELISIGDQHQMEWNDRMNLATSARWFEFLRSMEIGPEDLKPEEEQDDGCHPFNGIIEFPAWLNENDSCLQQHFVDDYSSPEYFQDPALPGMEFEEIDGMDGDWLG